MGQTYHHLAARFLRSRFKAAAPTCQYNSEVKRKPLTDEQKARKLELGKIWRDNNKDAVAAKNARYKARHPDVFKDYYAANRDVRLASSAAYQVAHPEATKAKARFCYLRRKALGHKIQRGKDDPESRRARNANRRALHKAAGSPITKSQVSMLMAAQRGKCIGCKHDIRHSFHIDHIQPLSRGGLHAFVNIQLLCPQCNMSKHAKDPLLWMQSIGYLL